MKKIYFMLSALALMALAACSNESDEIVKNVKQIKLSATMETLQGSQNTRTAIAETETGGVVTWKEGDQIAVVNEKGESAILRAESDGASVTFAGTVDESFGEIKYAFYPAESYSGFQPDGKATLALSNQVATSLAGLTNNPSCAMVSDGKATFKNVCGILKLNFEYDESVPFYNAPTLTLKGSPLTGKFTVDANDASITAGGLDAVSNLEIGTCPSNLSFSYFCIVPGGSSNIGVKIQDQYNTSTDTKTIKTTVGRNQIVEMPALSIEGTGDNGYYFN